MWILALRALGPAEQNHSSLKPLTIVAALNNIQSDSQGQRDSARDAPLIAACHKRPLCLSSLGMHGQVIDGWPHLFMLWRTRLFSPLWASYASGSGSDMPARPADVSWQVSPLLTLLSFTALCPAGAHSSVRSLQPWASGARRVWPRLLSSLRCCCQKYFTVIWSKLDSSTGSSLNLRGELSLQRYFFHVFSLHCLLPLLSPTRMAGVYPSGHWVRGRNTPWSGPSHVHHLHTLTPTTQFRTSSCPHAC